MKLHVHEGHSSQYRHRLQQHWELVDLFFARLGSFPNWRDEYETDTALSAMVRWMQQCALKPHNAKSFQIHSDSGSDCEERINEAVQEEKNRGAEKAHKLARNFIEKYDGQMKDLAIAHDVELKNIQDKEVKHRKQINHLIAEGEQDDALIEHLEKKSETIEKRSLPPEAMQRKLRRKVSRFI